MHNLKMPEFSGFEKEFFETDKSYSRFQNEALFQSLIRLKNEKEATQYLLGEKKTDFELRNNFINRSELKLKKIAYQDAAMTQYFRDCMNRRLGFILKYSSKTHTEDYLAMKKKIFWHRVELCSYIVAGLGFFSLIAVRYTPLRNNSLKFIYFFIAVMGVFGFHLIAFSRCFIRE